MKTRDERLAEETAALWREVFGEPAPNGDAESLLAIITGALPEITYERMSSPFLRPSLITGPRPHGKTA